jgi:hypothetical protein
MCLSLGARQRVVQFLPIHSFVGRYIILPSSTLRINDSSHTPQNFGPVWILTCQSLLRKDSAKDPLHQLIHIFHRSLVARASWPTSDSDDVWVEVVEELKDTLCSEFLSIVSMENLGVTNQAKYLLEFVCNQMGLLPWEGADSQSGGMILNDHNPMHLYSKEIPTWNLSWKFLEKIGLMDPFSFLVMGFFLRHAKQVMQ